MTVAMIQYKAGNIRSVTFALNRLGIEPVLTDDTETIRSADKVIFPGVGEASTAMKHLKEKNLHELIPTLKQPFIGICLGMQLMCVHSEEGDVDCLGIFPNHVKRFQSNNKGFKVPHIGWNQIYHLKAPLFNGVEENANVYFVHSYYADVMIDTAATCYHIQHFSAALQRDNFYGVQFHPEKSADTGELILKNFLAL